MKKLVIISGRTCSGKTGLSRRLAAEFGFHALKSSDMVAAEAVSRRADKSREGLQKLGDVLDLETDGGWLYTAVLKQINQNDNVENFVLDNVRTEKQLQFFRAEQSVDVIHVHLYAPTTELERRLARKLEVREVGPKKFAENDLMKVEADIIAFKNDADVRINSDRCDGDDTLVRTAARLGLYASPQIKCVDVIVGGQYGSEGKGNVAAYLSKEYDYLMRTGGPNAGHTVISRSGKYVYHLLPSGACDTDAKLLLGPGMTINVDKLLKEIDDCNVAPERLFIDPQAMVIEAVDIEAEGRIVKEIGSTGSGSGEAAARRITGRRSGNVRLVKDVPELKKFVGDGPIYRGSTRRCLERAYREGANVLFEGTQGSGLSIYHGEYPYVTSRNTNVAGCLAEAGISPSHVRRILLVVRSTPIRVANPDGIQGATSGPLKHEVDFEVVAKSAKIKEWAQVKEAEKTSTTNRYRRVGWFEWDQFRDACALNAPTDIVLTFSDYIDERNTRARRFEQLTEDTIKFVEEIERVARAPVSLINTRFAVAMDKTRTCVW